MRGVQFSALVILLIAAAPRIGWGADGDLDALKGTWGHLPKGEPDKFEVTEKGTYKVRFTNGEKEEGSITVDPEASPKTIDLTINSDPDKGKVRKGLYALQSKKGKGGKTILYMYLSKPGGERPKEIPKEGERTSILWAVER